MTDPEAGFRYRTREPAPPLRRLVELVWYARGTITYQRERIAPTGSTVAVLVLGDPIIERADDGRGPSVRSDVESHLRETAGPLTPRLERSARAVALLEDDPTLPVARIATMLGVSHGHLDREFRRSVDLAPRALARLLRVRRLLEALDVRSHSHDGVASMPDPEAQVDATPDDPRVTAVTGMCSHRVDLTDLASVDDTVAAWIRMAYDRAA